MSREPHPEAFVQKDADRWQTIFGCWCTKRRGSEAHELLALSLMFVGVIQSSRLTHGFRRVVQLCQLTPLTVRLSSSSCNGPQPMSRFGTERTALAREVALLMDALPQPPPYFLDNGTLLGLWREGALINSDDDFDFGVLVQLPPECAERWLPLDGWRLWYTLMLARFVDNLLVLIFDP